jgi:8-oxo-dGTP pyrophosphatase MutT (NUDIX family)
VRPAQARGVLVVRKAENRDIRISVRDLDWIGPPDVCDHEVWGVDRVARDQVMALKARFQLAADEEVDAFEQDRRHDPSSVTLRIVDEWLRNGLDLIRRGEYFEAHEELEEAWRAAEPAEKDFFQGLVHVTVAWHHAGRGNRPGCERQLAKARRRLTPFAPLHRGIDLARLLRSVDEAARIVEAGSLDLPSPALGAATWDDVPVAMDPPHGCAIVLWREASRGREYLVLHRRHAGPPGYEGDWAWTPPSGSRQPGERLEEAARRELAEETGLELSIRPTEFGSEKWPVFAAQAPTTADVALDAEHDQFRWVPAETAAALCLPSAVGRTITAVDAWLSEAPPR